MAGEYAFVMRDLRKVVPPKREILRGIRLSFFHGAKIGVLGANGAGKSTLLRIMAGVDRDFLGEAFPAEGLRIGYLQQEPQLDPGKDVRGNIEEGVAGTRALLTRFEEVSARLGEPLEADEIEKLLAEQARLQDAIDAANAWDLDRTVELAMDALRVPPGDMDVTKISGGERRRVALCRLLLARPDMLLLDEPTNHLDAESVAWLERFLKEYPGTVVAITHDRYFLDNVAGWILELDRGQGIPWEGNYSSWLEQKGRRLEQEEKADLARRRTLERELEWVRMAPRARQAKSKARLSNYEALLAESSAERAAALEIAIPPGPRLGDLVVEADHVTKAYGDRVLVDDLSFKLPRGGIVGVIGPNGAGKTTLFGMITNFKGSDQQKRVADLSGGERNRLHLATMLKRGANLLLLDEPTNDLDVDTLRALEDALLDFAGCAVVISHDRWFLDRIATHILAFEDEGRVVWVEGSYADYEADRKKRLGAEAERPHRLRGKRLRPA